MKKSTTLNPNLSQKNNNQQEESLLQDEEEHHLEDHNESRGDGGNANNQVTTDQQPFFGEEHRMGTSSFVNIADIWSFEVNENNTHDRRFRANQIRTSKYTPLTFIPKNLLEQFSKMANIYFLFIMVLQIIPPISISGGQPAILMPLVFVITVSAIKDLFEDIQRHKSDNQENNRKVLVANPGSGQFEEKLWKTLKVGNVVKVQKDQFFPADLLLLNSSAPKGICYVETKNLDGETNLKHKSSHKEILNHCKTEGDVIRLNAKVNCEKPSEKIYQFEGVFILNSKRISLSYDNFLLRGSSLKNTDWVYGVVVFTGHDTRIMKNSTGSRAKKSQVEQATNKNILYIFFLQLCFCVVATLIGTIWNEQHNGNDPESGKDAWYLELDPPGDTNPFDNSWALNAIQRFGSWILIFTNMVPISLMVTLEVVKFIQAFFIQWDFSIYDIDKDLATNVQASNLNEELGQVSYVFSDKTGTLTCNVMEFKKFSAGKYSYGTNNGDNETAMRFNNEGEKEEITNVNFDDPTFYQHFKERGSENYVYIEKLLLALAVCHTVIIEKKDGKLIYNASSPDELALVNAARFFGMKLVDRDEDNNVVINFQGQILKYQLLNLIEFNSTRKRMSVVIRDPKGVIRVICKGADSVLIPLLNEISSENLELKPITEEYLEDYAKQGLRTLLLAEKIFPSADYEIWNAKYQEACFSLKNREEQLEKLAEEIEKDFILIGSTAIEDKLQDGVGDTIQSLKDAGIKVWVLTGDKVETAINIGYSCKLLNNDMLQLLITAASTRAVYEQLQECKKQQALTLDEQDSAIIVNGDALIKIEQNKDLKNSFLELASLSKVVLACRVSPKQKAEIVMYIRKQYPSARTLAIGDGANDVNMITSAHVGVGISGLEGQQAARIADYAIGQFKYLKNLLFVHGRECYRRNSYLVIYMFYKNILFVVPQFWFGFLSVFSGQTLYEQWIYQLFNIIFTSIPVMWFAIFDQQYTRDHLLLHPECYAIGLYNICFGKWYFWRWMFYGVALASLLNFIPFYSIEGPTTNDQYGQPSCLWVSGNTVYAYIVIIVNVKIFYDTNTHTLVSISLQILSICSFFFVYGIEQLFSYFPQVYLTWQYMVHIPAYNILVLFFIVYTLQSEATIFRIGQWYLEEKERRRIKEEEEAIEKRRKSQYKLRRETFTKHTGFAFSQEGGHVPQLTRKLTLDYSRKHNKLDKSSSSSFEGTATRQRQHEIQVEERKEEQIKFGKEIHSREKDQRDKADNNQVFSIND